MSASSTLVRHGDGGKARRHCIHVDEWLGFNVGKGNGPSSCHTSHVVVVPAGVGGD